MTCQPVTLSRSNKLVAPGVCVVYGPLITGHLAASIIIVVTIIRMIIIIILMIVTNVKLH